MTFYTFIIEDYLKPDWRLFSNVQLFNKKGKIKNALAMLQLIKCTSSSCSTVRFHVLLCVLPKSICRSLNSLEANKKFARQFFKPLGIRLKRVAKPG